MENETGLGPGRRGQGTVLRSKFGVKLPSIMAAYCTHFIVYHATNGRFPVRFTPGYNAARR